MSVSRRGFLKHAGTGLATTAGVLAFPGSARAASHGMRVSGSGSYALGPFPHGDDPNGQAYLITDLGFDETMVYCKVTTNFEPLIFPTAERGNVPLPAHTFFMDMQSTRIDSLEVQDGPDGLSKAIYRGVMSSETRVGLHGDPNQMIFIEHEIAYDCVAEDDNAGTPVEVAISKNFFSMTGHFSPGGGHRALFGPMFTFKGTLTGGNIVIEKGVDGQIPVLTFTNTTNAARGMEALVGDGWRLNLNGVTSNAPIYLKIWREDADGGVIDLGVSGPYGGLSDDQGMWSHFGSFDSTVVGTWRMKAVVGDPDSTERSANIRFNVMSS